MTTQPQGPGIDLPALSETILRAISSCGHVIDSGSITLHFDPKQPGHNALNQLSRRITAAVLADRSRVSAGEPVRAALNVPDGYELLAVKNFAELVEALARADRKGYMPDAMASEWEAFNYCKPTDFPATPLADTPAQPPTHAASAPVVEPASAVKDAQDVAMGLQLKLGEQERLTGSLMDMIGRISAALGISEEDQSCANGDEEILQAIEDLRGDGEPVSFQYWTVGEFWRETSRLGYEARRDAGEKVRALYTNAPSSTVAASPDVEQLTENGEYWPNPWPSDLATSCRVIVRMAKNEKPNGASDDWWAGFGECANTIGSALHAAATQASSAVGAECVQVSLKKAEREALSPEALEALQNGSEKLARTAQWDRDYKRSQAIGRANLSQAPLAATPLPPSLPAAQPAEPMTDESVISPESKLFMLDKIAKGRGFRNACEALASLPHAGQPLATLQHDAGAYAQCFYCRRYSLDPRTLSDRQPACDCGKKDGWSGSFTRPQGDAQWSSAAPAGEGETR